MAFCLVNDGKYKDLKYFIPDNLKNDKIAAAFTTRLGGVSGEDFVPLRSLNLAFKDIDTPENVLKNYDIIADILGFSVNNIVSLHQQHTDDIIICDKNYAANHAFPAKDIADAVITNIRGMLLSVKIADCVPVLFYDEKNMAIGAAHCGWRGTLKELQKKTALKMAEIYGSALDEIKVAVGACISACCYEVSDDIFKEFYDKFGDFAEQFFEKKPNGKYNFDLKNINRQILINNGIKAENIEISENCTFCEEDLFFSHRRDGEKRGTLAAFIGIR